MTVYDELVARGLIAQVTDEEEIKKLINEGKAVFYIGFDPTADSLHVGNFMALCLMKRLQMAGNKPIALIGGGTAMIGDPSGRKMCIRDRCMIRAKIGIDRKDKAVFVCISPDYRRKIFVFDLFFLLVFDRTDHIFFGTCLQMKIGNRFFQMFIILFTAKKKTFI